MRTIVVRECSCADPNSCSQACGSEMVNRPYVEAIVTDEMVEMAAEAMYGAMRATPGGTNYIDLARAALVAALREVDE